MMDTDMGLADLLPQPYRMISEIIELDILDIGWLAILRRHPEINLDASGNPAPVKRNHGLLHTINSTAKKEIPIADLPSAFFHIRLNSKRGVLTGEDWLCLVDINGMLRITRNSDNSEVIKESLLSSPSSAEAPTNPVEETKESQTTLRFDAYVVVQSPHPNRDPVLRLVFHDILSVKTPRIVEGGKKGKVEEPPQFDVKMFFRFVIVDLSPAGTSGGGGGGDRKEKLEPWSITRRMEILQDNMDESVGRSKEMMCSADFSSDARWLLLSTAGGSEAGVRLFQLPDPFPESSSEAATAASTTPEEPALVFQLEHNSKLLNGSAVLKAFLIPSALSAPPPPPSSSSSSSSTPAADMGSVLPDVVVTLRANTVLLLGLRPNPDFAQQLAQQQQLQEEAKKKKDKDKDSAPPPLPLPVSCFQIGQWTLTSSCSASLLCDARRLLVLGLVDGSVAFWQLAERRYLGTAATHPGQVTALIDLDGSSSQAAVLGPAAPSGQRAARGDVGAVTIVSAALDGSICVFSPRPPPSALKLGSSLGAGGAADSPLGLPPLRDYRYDVAGSGVLALLPMPAQPNLTSSAPARGFFAQYSCGTVVAYEWQPDLGSVELKGSLSKAEKDPLQPLNWIVLAPCTVQAVQEQRDRQIIAEQVATAAPEPILTPGVGQPASDSAGAEEAVPAAEGADAAESAAGEGNLSSLFATLPMHRFIAAVVVGQHGLLQLYSNLREEKAPPDQGKTVLVSYPLSAFGGVFSAGDGADRFDWVADSYLDGNSAAPSKPFKAKQVTSRASKPSSSSSSVHSAVSASSMKLTKARLAAFTESQAPSQHSKGSKLRGARPQLPPQPLLPDKAVLSDLLNSKLDRAGRKVKLANNLKDLLTYM